MVFSSIVFIFIFLPAFLLCYFISKKRKTKNLILLLFSLLFYAYGEPIYIFIMMGSIVVNYLFGKKVGKSKLAYVVAIIFNLGLLIVFKYTNFFIENAVNIFNLNIKMLELSLPIGISFYTFQILSYIIDVRKGKVPVQESIINLGCYVSAFPQLIAGPIVRYKDVNEELENRKENVKDFSEGIKRFIIGLGKKVLIANQMALIADSLFKGSLIQIGFIGSFIGAICYTLQIYFDFSGYSDMAIGLGRMLGFHYLENFNYPYIASSVTDFWRRWHISLSSFFRDYVYIPLGGNRVSVLKHIRNIIIVWLLTGLWHGASWNFILWGLYYGIFLLIEKYLLKNILEKVPGFIKHLYTLLIIIVGWVIFYFTDFNLLSTALTSLFGLNGFGDINILYTLQIITVPNILAFIIAIIACIPWNFKFKNKTIENILLILLFIISIIFVLVSSYNPFIYYRF